MLFRISFVALFLLKLVPCFAKNTHDIFNEDAFVIKQALPVTNIYFLPWWWSNYNGETTAFDKATYDETVGKKSAEQFLKDVLKVNKVDQRGEEVTVYKFPIEAGTLYVAHDYYYATVNADGELVSLFIEGEEHGKYPNEIPFRYHGDDLLCFFKGPRAYTCAIGDDT